MWLLVILFIVFLSFVGTADISLVQLMLTIVWGGMILMTVVSVGMGLFGLL